jgi:hypothetical protein
MSKRLPQPQPRNCLSCAKSFTPKMDRARYCHKICSDHARYLAPPPLPRDCLSCGKSFTPKTERKRYCNNVCSTRAWQKGPGKAKYKAAVKRHELTDKAKDWRKAAAVRLRAKLYGLTVEEMNKLLAAGCYAPGCKRGGTGKNGLHIDHDHFCCPGKKSCGKCVRGALCSRHNIFLGYLEEDPLFAMWVIRNPTFMLKIRREA